jgi:hypothetical protein
MNLKNAFSFFVLGLLMHSTPVLAQSLSAVPVAVVESSVRMVWLEFMGWVIGGIGFAYIAHEGLVRLPILVKAVVPARYLRPIETRTAPVQMQAVVRVGLTY